MENSLYSLSLYATSFVLFGLAVFAWRHRDVAVAYPFTVTILISSIWSFSAGLDSASDNLEFKVRIFQIWFTFVSFLAVAVLTTGFTHIKSRRWLTKRYIGILLVIPTITVLLVWTFPYHNLLWTNLSLRQEGALSVLRFGKGIWYWVYIGYSYLLYFIFYVAMISSLKKSRPLIRNQTILIILSVALPFTTDALYQLGITFPAGYNMTPNALLGTGVLLSWALFRYRMLGIIPVARSMLVENMSDGVLVLDQFNLILDSNASAAKLFNRSQAELYGASIIDVFPDWQPVFEEFELRGSSQAEVTFTNAAGEVLFLDIRVRPISRGRSSKSSLLIVIREITQQKQTEQKLLMQSAALQSAANGIVITDTAGMIIWVNSAFTFITGYPQSEVIGNHIRVLKSGFHDQHFYSDLWNTILSGAVWHGEITNRRKDGTYYHEEMTIAPIKDESGQIIHFVAIKEDITIRKETENHLRRQKAYLEALQETTIGLVSHLDLNTLLESIVRRAGELVGTSHGFLELVSEDRPTLEPKVGIGLMEESLKHWVRKGEGLAGKVWETGAPVIIEDYDHWVGRVPTFKLDTIRSIIGVPLSIDNDVIGVLGIAYDRNVDRVFAPEDVDLLTQFGQLAAIAIDNARLFETERSARNKAETLQATVQALSSTLNLQEVLDLILSELQKVVPYNSSSVFQLRGDFLELVSGRGFSNLEELIGTRFHIRDENTPSTIVLKTLKPYILDDAPSQYQGFKEEKHAGAQIRGWMGIPLLFGEQLIGMLAVDKKEPGFYTDVHANMALAFSSQAAMAIHNARLYAAISDALIREQHLGEIARILSSTLDLSTILKNLVRLAAEMVGAQIGVIGLISPDGHAINYQYTYNLDPASIPRPKPRNESVAWQVVSTGEPIVLDNYYSHPSAIPEWSEFGAKAYLGVPIESGEERIGSLGLFSNLEGKLFTDLDLALVQAIGRQAAFAIQNARRFDQERDRRHRQEVLLRLSNLLSTINDENEIWQSVTNAIADQTLNYEYIGTYEWDKTSGDRMVRGQVGGSQDRIGRKLPQHHGLSRYPLIDGELYYTPDVRAVPDYIPGLNLGAEVDVPIKIGHEIVGVLSIENSIPYSFSQEDFEVFTAAANQVGIALGRARLLKETRQRLNELVSINAISQASASQLELDALIEMVGESIRQTFMAEAVFVALYDREAEEITIPYWTYYDNRIEYQKHPFGKGLASQIIKTRNPLLINQNYLEVSAELGARWVVGNLYNDFPKSWLGVPIQAGEMVIGVISAQNFSKENAFSEDDVRLLTTIAANVGIALRNAQLYTEVQIELGERKRAEQELREANEKLHEQLASNEALRAQLREQAMRDPLTGLFNRRYLNESLDRELSRALREDYIISLVMIDIDSFKQFNDSYGHKVGDRLLQMLSGILSNQSRHEDIACRYGGEEFLIVLPRTSMETAYKRAEHWRTLFEKLPVLEDGTTLNSTLSIGIASFPEHGDASEEILNRADQAMYMSKKRGKNQTTIYPDVILTRESELNSDNM